MRKELIQENFRDKVLALLPEERRLDMMMVINDAGLRSDDEAFALLYVMGYIKTLYEDMPDAVEQMNNVVWQMAESVDGAMQKKLKNCIDGMKIELQAQSNQSITDIQKIGLRFC